MTFTALAFIALIGVTAGVINGTVGGGSLLTYPVLVLHGLPPVIAAATNTTGLATGNLFALIPHRDGKVVDLRPWKWHALATASGALIGGVILILAPERVFEFLVPVMLVAASLSMFLKLPHPDARQRHPRSTRAWLVLSGMYNGYFGPGQGVLAIAILSRDGRLSMQQSVVIKNFVLAASNVVVAILFIATGHVRWVVALVLLVSVAAGGWFGGAISHRVNPTVLRLAVAGVGLVSAVWFVAGR